MLLLVVVKWNRGTVKSILVHRKNTSYLSLFTFINIHLFLTYNSTKYYIMTLDSLSFLSFGFAVFTIVNVCQSFLLEHISETYVGSQSKSQSYTMQLLFHNSLQIPFSAWTSRALLCRQVLLILSVFTEKTLCKKKYRDL